MFRFFVVVVFVSDELYPLRSQCTAGGTLGHQQVLKNATNMKSHSECLLCPPTALSTTVGFKNTSEGCMVTYGLTLQG